MAALEDISGIQSARDAGYSDDEIYAHLAGRPEFAKAKEAGYSFNDVYQHIYSKAQEQAKGIQEETLGIGSPVGATLAALRGNLKVAPKTETREGVLKAMTPEVTKADSAWDALKEGRIGDFMGSAVESVSRKLSPLLGPTERQKIEEAVPTARGYEFKPAGDAFSREGLLPALMEGVAPMTWLRGMKLMSEGKPADLEAIQEDFAKAHLSHSSTDSPSAGVGKAVYNSLLDAAQSFTNPALLAIPQSKVIGGAFAADMLKSGVQQASAASDSSKPLGERVEKGIGSLISLSMGGAAAAHLALGEKAPVLPASESLKIISTIPRQSLEAALSEPELSSHLHPEVRKMVEGELGRREQAEGPKSPSNPEFLDGLHAARNALTKGFESQPPEIQKQRQEQLDEIDAQLLRHDRTEVNESAARTAQPALRTEPPAPSAKEEVQPSPPQELSELDRIKQELRSRGSTLTADAIESSPPPTVEPPALGQPEPPIAGEERPPADEVAPVTEGAAVKPEPGTHIKGPALIGEDGKPLIVGEIGETHQQLKDKLISDAKARGDDKAEAAAITSEHGFVDDKDNVHDRFSGFDLAESAKQIPDETVKAAKAFAASAGEKVKPELHSDQLVRVESVPKIDPVKVENYTKNLPEGAAKVVRDVLLAGKSVEEAVVDSGLTKKRAQEIVDRARPFLEQAKTVEPPKERVYVDEPSAGGRTDAPELEAIRQQEEGYEGGPGAMGPVEAEAMKQVQTKTSTKNAVVDEERVKRGQPPMMGQAKQALGAIWDSAMTAIDRNPERGRELVHEIIDKPRAVTAQEEAILLHHKVDVMNDFEEASRRALDEQATPEEKQEASARAAKLMDDLNDIDSATRISGAEWGRTGRFRQQLAAEDYSLSKMLQKKQLAKGVSLTEVETKQVAKLQERIDELEKKLAAKEETTEATRETSKNEEVQKAIERVKKKNQPPSPQEQLDKIVAAIKRNKDVPEKVGSWIQKLAEHFVRNGVDQREALVDAVHGAVKEVLPDATNRQIRDAISGYGDYHELSKDEVKVKLRDLKGQMQQVSKLDDMLKSGKLPAKTGVERRVPSVEERALAKEVNRVKKELGLEATDPNQLKSSLDAIKTRLKNQIEDLNRAVERNEKLPSKGKSAVDDAETLELRRQRDEVRKLYDEMVGVDTPAMEAAKEATLVKNINDLKSQIESGDVEPKIGKSTVDTEAVAKLKAQRDELLKQKEEIRKAKNPPKSEDERRVDALEKRATELREKINKGDISSKTGKPTVDTKEVAAAKEELSKLNKQLSDLRKLANPPKTPEEIRERALDKRISELEEKLSKGDISVKEGTPTVDTKEIAEKKAKLRSLNDQLTELRKAARPKLTPDQIALKVVKSRMETRLKDLNDRLARGDFSSAPRKTVTLDPEGLKLKAAVEKAKLEFDRGLYKDRLGKRSLWEKGLDFFPKIFRAGLLSNPVTLGKLTAAATWRMIGTPIEEGIGSGLRELPLVSEVAARAPREGGGLNVRAESAAMTKGIVRGMKDGYDMLTKGETELDLAGGKRNVIPHEWYDFFGQIHGALKSVTKRSEFERSLQKRIEFNMANGVDVTDPMVQARLTVEAYKDANRSIFMQDNFIVSRYNRFVRSLEEVKKETGEPSVTGKTTAAALKTLLPIVKIPTNIAAETFQYAVGTLTGSIRLTRAFSKGIETLKPEQADLIMRELKKGSLGGALITLGYLLPNVIGGYYQKGQKRKGDEVKTGEIKIGNESIPSYLLHNPAVEQVQIGATLRKVAESKLKVKDNEKQGIPAGVLAAGLGVSEEIPFVREQIELGKAFDPQQRSRYFGELARSRLEPQIIQWIAQQMDRRDGEVIRREPKTIVEHLESGIPGLRKNVPEKREKVAPTSKRKRR